MPFSCKTLKKSSLFRKVIVNCFVLVLTFWSKMTYSKKSCVVWSDYSKCTMSITIILTDFSSNLDKSSC